MMTKNALFYYKLPDATKNALTRLENALRRDGIGGMRTDYSNGHLVAYVDDERGHVHYIKRFKNDWFENRRVDE